MKRPYTSTPYLPGDRVRCVFPAGLAGGKVEDYSGTIIGIFNAEHRIWRVQPDSKTKPEAVHAAYIWRIPAAERMEA